jgi:hypothetical protein
MNVALFEKIKTQILEEPKRLDMQVGLLFNAWKSTNLPSWRVPACGTIGCIAGWAVMLSDNRITRSLDVGRVGWDFSWGFVSLTAAQVLDVPEDVLDQLFHVSNWDIDLQDSYYEAIAEDLLATRAKITVMAIDRFVAKYSQVTWA